MIQPRKIIRLQYQRVVELEKTALPDLFPRLTGDDWTRAAPAAALGVLLAEEIEGSRFTA